MRKWNGWISLFVLILLVIHGVAGGFQLFGLMSGGKTWHQVLSWVMIGLLAVHIVIGIVLTVDTLRTKTQKDTAYARENVIFWTRRISGFAMIILIVFHFLLFSQTGTESFRLSLFEGPQLAASLLLVLAAGIHVVTNIRPLLISFGARGWRKFVWDLLLIAAIVAVFCGAAFIVYYCRWNLFWR